MGFEPGTYWIALLSNILSNSGSSGTYIKGCKGSLPPIKHDLVFKYKIEDSFRAVAISVW